MVNHNKEIEIMFGLCFQWMGFRPTFGSFELTLMLRVLSGMRVR